MKNIGTLSGMYGSESGSNEGSSFASLAWVDHTSENMTSRRNAAETIDSSVNS